MPLASPLESLSLLLISPALICSRKLLPLLLIKVSIYPAIISLYYIKSYLKLYINTPLFIAIIIYKMYLYFCLLNYVPFPFLLAYLYKLF